MSKHFDAMNAMQRSADEFAKACQDRPRLAPQSRIEVEQLVIGGLNALSDEVRALGKRFDAGLILIMRPDKEQWNEYTTCVSDAVEREKRIEAGVAALAEQVGKLHSDTMDQFEILVTHQTVPINERLAALAEQVGKLGEAHENEHISLCRLVELENCSSADWLQTRTLLDLTNKRLAALERKLDGLDIGLARFVAMAKPTKVSVARKKHKEKRK